MIKTKPLELGTPKQHHQLGSRFPFVAPLSSGAVWQPTAAWDTILIETAHHVVVPTRGSLQPGWVLIVPKRRCISFADSSRDQLNDLAQLSERIRLYLHGITNTPIVMWENGAFTSSTSLGCGVDQAHLHVLPLDIDLRRAATALSSELSWEKINDLSDTIQHWTSGRSYLYVQEANRNRYCAYSPNVPGQFMRRVIALALGKPNEFDWRLSDGLQNVLQTIEMFHINPSAY